MSNVRSQHGGEHPDRPHVNADLLMCFATAPRGLESLLARELTALDLDDVREGRSGVAFSGDITGIYRACLWSRVANRILLQIAQFDARDLEAIHAGIRHIDWSRHMRGGASFAVDFRQSGKAVGHSRYAVHRIKDAIVDGFRERNGTRPDVSTTRPDVRISVWLHRGRVSVALDLSGESLHRRGYRLAGVNAPMKENLAAAVLMRAGWMQTDTPHAVFVDPMCGSGTLPIEAALMAADIAPGLQREYWGFHGWRGHREQIWQTLLDEATARREAGLRRLPMIRGYDSDPRAVRLAMDNVARAGLSGHVHIERKALGECGPESGKGPGLMVVNPPWGERLGEYARLPALYRDLGRWIKRCLPGWNASVLTAVPEMGQLLEMRAHRKHKVINGAIACELLHFHINEQATGTQRRERPVDMFINRLRKNLRNLRRWREREGISCYRVYDADLPEYALAIDIYESDRKRVHVQEYAPPRSVDADQARHRLLTALAELPEALETDPGDLYFKVRQSQKGNRQYQRQAQTGEFFEINEYGVRLLVNLADYLDTGLFLDHRLVRRYLQEHALGKRFLNLFAYTGAATVHAAAGGAVETTTIDLSRTYLDWARRNMALNGFKDSAHRFIRADAMQWLRDEQGKRRFDLVFLDPPSFSNSSNMRGTLDIQRDHARLIRHAMRLLADNGLLVFSCNLRRFRLDASLHEQFSIKDYTRQSIPRDFERHRGVIHHCWLIRP